MHRRQRCEDLSHVPPSSAGDSSAMAPPRGQASCVLERGRSCVALITVRHQARPHSIEVMTAAGVG